MKISEPTLDRAVAIIEELKAYGCKTKREQFAVIAAVLLILSGRAGSKYSKVR